jgi:membrane fusion protein (multidrug efflux system)
MDTTAQPKSKKLTWIILGILLIIIILGIGWYIVNSERYPSTDDSYVQAHIVNIAPQVSGQIQSINVRNHQLVKKGQILFTINPDLYQYAYQQADAQLKLANEKAARLFPLIKTGKVAPSEGDQIKAQIQEAKAALGTATYNLNHTQVLAPADGAIANFTVRVGDSVSTGIALFAIVEQNHFWVNANFKETQLKRIKMGQSAVIKVDMYPGHKFKGIVQSRSPGSGTIFSLLPPENATGNWVKVTQRVPVKIEIMNLNPKYPLLAGTSAVATVDTVHNDS